MGSVTQLTPDPTCVVAAKRALILEIVAAVKARYEQTWDAAEALGIPPSSLYYLVNGHHERFSLRYLIELADRLGRKLVIRFEPTGNDADTAAIRGG